MMSNGQGYASSSYQDTVVTDYLQHLPANAKIYTNSPPAIYSSTGRRSYILFLDAGLTKETQGFYSKINREVKKGDAVLAFYGIHKEEMGTEAYEYLVDGLTLSVKIGTNLIYDNRP